MGDYCGKRVPDSPTALNQAEGPASPFAGPRFRYQRGAAVPFTAHAQTYKETADREHRDGSGKAAGKREKRVRRDAETEHFSSSEAIGEDAKHEAADRRSDQSDGVQEARGRLFHIEIAHQVREDDGVEQNVEGIKHPSQGGGDEGAALRGRSLFPAERTPGYRSDLRGHEVRIGLD